MQINMNDFIATQQIAYQKCSEHVGCVGCPLLSNKPLELGYGYSIINCSGKENKENESKVQE